MAKFELKLPKMGESVAEATITSWLKDVGDAVDMDDPVLEIATDKVDSEVPSEVEGVLVERFFNTDDVVQVGQVLAIIETKVDDNFSVHSKEDVVVKVEDINNEGIDIRIESNIVPDSKTQEEAIEWLSTSSNGILKALPGMGKTVCAIESICRRKKKTIIIVHKKDVL